MQLSRPIGLVSALALAVAGVAGYAQIEGDERGVVPIDTSNALEVGGIEVDVSAKTAELARLGGWREAQRKGWRMLWAKYHNGAGAPALGDGALDSLVSAIVIEDEQIGPNRYIARLGITFDRVRAAEVMGVGGQFSRSAPMLVLPVMWSGGTPVSFEQRTEWQKAWANFRAGSSSIDYVRPSGNGADPLLLNFGQTGRPGRRWWRALLDQYGAADVLIPTVRLMRSYPGGPITGQFSAHYGPDNRVIESFTLVASSPADLPRMMAEGVKRMDGIYSNALAAGLLRPDTSLIIEQPIDPEALPEDSELLPLEGVLPSTDSTPLPTDRGDDDDDGATPNPVAAIESFSIQFETPDADSVGSVESAVRGIPGVKSASTSSLALGGTSVMRVTFQGDEGMLKLGLAARGFSVSGGGGSLRISR
jgi:hypothetical protein